jgi:replicative DNA helicase
MADGAARVPPSNLDAEAAVLSASLLDPTRDALDRARTVLGTGAAFYSDANRRIWEAILDLDQEGKPADVVTVRAWLAARNRLSQVGGVAYLAQISDATPAVAHVEEHARLVVEKARQRSLVALGQRLAAEGYGELEDAQGWALGAAQAVADIAAAGGTEDPTERFDELMPRVTAELAERSRTGNALTGIDTGFLRLNAILGGWEVGKMHVIAGRPGMGKTSAVICASLNVAKRGYGVIIGSAEMEKEELAKRCLAVEANVNLRHVMSGRMNAEEWAAVTAAAVRLAKLPLSIKYCPGATIGELRAAFRKESRRLPPLGLAAVDYIQILDGERKSGDNRETEVSGLTRRLTWLAQEFRVPLLAVSQINRAVEARSNANKRPQISDLRESGAIEQDAYSVSMLYRDEYYDKESSWAGTLEWNVAKHRNGPTGMARLAFVSGSTMVANLAEDEQWGLYDDEERP